MCYVYSLTSQVLLINRMSWLTYLKFYSISYAHIKIILYKWHLLPRGRPSSCCGVSSPAWPSRASARSASPWCARVSVGPPGTRGRHLGEAGAHGSAQWQHLVCSAATQLLCNNKYRNQNWLSRRGSGPRFRSMAASRLFCSHTIAL